MRGARRGERRTAVARARWYARLEALGCPAQHRRNLLASVDGYAPDELSHRFSLKNSVSHLEGHAMLTHLGAVLIAAGTAALGWVYGLPFGLLQVAVGIQVLRTARRLVPLWRTGGDLCPIVAGAPVSISGFLARDAYGLAALLTLSVVVYPLTQTVADFAVQAGCLVAAAGLVLVSQAASKRRVSMLRVPLAVTAWGAAIVAFGDAAWAWHGATGFVETLGSALAAAGTLAFACSAPRLLCLYRDRPQRGRSDRRTPDVAA